MIIYIIYVCPQFTEAGICLRNKENHAHHCKLIDMEGLTDHYSLCFGINRNPILNELRYFDVTSGALLNDIMHDILEGVLPMEMKLMLQVHEYIF